MYTILASVVFYTFVLMFSYFSRFLFSRIEANLCSTIFYAPEQDVTYAYEFLELRLFCWGGKTSL